MLGKIKNFFKELIGTAAKETVTIEKTTQSKAPKEQTKKPRKPRKLKPAVEAAIEAPKAKGRPKKVKENV